MLLKTAPFALFGGVFPVDISGQHAAAITALGAVDGVYDGVKVGVGHQKIGAGQG